MMRLAPWDDFGRLEAEAWLNWIKIHEPELRTQNLELENLGHLGTEGTRGTRN
jgi:hypothetical protein